jgi:hypothetical protein
MVNNRKGTAAGKRETMILPKWTCGVFALPDKPMMPGHALGKVTRRVQHGFVDQDGITDAGELKRLTESGITSAYAAFGTLRIWRDLDQNGVTDAGELPLMIRMAT